MRMGVIVQVVIFMLILCAVDHCCSADRSFIPGCGKFYIPHTELARLVVVRMLVGTG